MKIYEAAKQASAVFILLYRVSGSANKLLRISRRKEKESLSIIKRYVKI